MSMTGWTESEEQIQRRKERILRDAPRVQRAQGILERLFPGFMQAQRIARLHRAVSAYLTGEETRQTERFINAVRAYLDTDHGTTEKTLAALRELRSATVNYRSFVKGE